MECLSKERCKRNEYAKRKANRLSASPFAVAVAALKTKGCGSNEPKTSHNKNYFFYIWG